MTFDARAVANYLLDYAEFRRRPVTHLALQKLIYFCHGWYLAKFNQPLIKEPVEAWGHGPVYRSVYQCLSKAKKEHITFRATRTDFSTGENKVVCANFDERTQKFMEDIFDLYSRFTASDLRRISHVDGGPWHQVWSASQDHPIAGMRIPNELIQQHFKHDTHDLTPQ